MTRKSIKDPGKNQNFRNFYLARWVLLVEQELLTAASEFTCFLCLIVCLFILFLW